MADLNNDLKKTKDMQNKKMKPELLAPAGNLTTAITAFDYGADAVYAGLAKFNARERTENFTEDELSKLIAYARKIKRNVYVTLNTLIKESEIPELFNVLEILASLRPDAVIVQDLGVLHVIKNYFPCLTVHASTQMGLHNSAGLHVADKLGIKRVILERQVTLDEIKLMAPESPVELEVFVHGALCCSLSGNCLFSSWLGGWSGNRGKCKQPCRRRFFGNKQNGFFFSTKDLYSLDLLQEYQNLNIASLKIEGRLRKPDYVKSVVSAYRMMLDSPEQSIKKAKNVLNHSFGRKWSHGFSTLKDFKDVIEHTRIGSSGQLCGQVVGGDEHGFFASLSRGIRIGDRIRIQPQTGEEGPAITLTKLTIDSRNKSGASKGQTCFIHCNKEVPADGLVYKIGESSDELVTRIDQLEMALPVLDLFVKVNAEQISVTVSNMCNSPTWTEKVEFQKAEKCAASPESIIKEFTLSKSKKFDCGCVKAKVASDLFIPASTLKKIRIAFWKWVDDSVKMKFDRSLIIAGLTKYEKAKMSDLQIKVSTYSTSHKLPFKKSRYDVVCKSIYNYGKMADELMLPAFCSEYKLQELKELIQQAYESGISRFRVTSLFAFDLLKKYKNIKILTSYPLPVANSLAAKEISQLEKKTKSVQAWVELEQNEIYALRDKVGLPLEIFRFGKIPLMATRAVIPVKGALKDSRGGEFYVKKDKHTEITYLYPKEYFKLPAIDKTLSYYDIKEGKLSSNYTSSFNYDHNLL